MAHILTATPSIANQFLIELRDARIQQDRAKFRSNLFRLGAVMGYELSKHLAFERAEVRTPLGSAEAYELKDHPVLVTILRAGLPLHDGLASVFDRSDQGFVTACRKYKEGSHDDFYIGIDAVSAPELSGRTLVLSDPMLATGASLVQVLEALMESHGVPSQLHIVSAIASASGLAHVQRHLPENGHIWVGDVDEELSDKGYIVPGLGDAGDLSFGMKM